jgi:hypothetical protein
MFNDIAKELSSIKSLLQDIKEILKNQKPSN